MENLTQLYIQFSKWLETVQGKQLLNAESIALQPILEKMSGLSLLMIGSNSQKVLIPLHRLKQSSILSPLSLDSTPISYENFDQIVLPHTLEWTADPFSLLRKVTKALKADGYLIIIHFNPWNLWRIFRWLSFQKQKMPDALKGCSSFQIKNWLNALHFEVDTEKSFSYHQRLEKSQPSILLTILKWITLPFLDSIHLYVAKKENGLSYSSKSGLETSLIRAN